MTQAVHIRLYGRVQGVGFRYTARNRARSLGLRGWVRNLPDRTVEAVVEGEAEDIQRFNSWCRRGDPPARVDRADIVAIPVKGSYTGFEIRH